MANSAEASFNEMLKVANVTDIDELFEKIPKDHIFKGDWNFDPQIPSEAALYKHLTRILRKNSSAEENLNFLGAGCWQHYVPAICDEMVTRTEFLTPVWGTPSSDHGRNQVWFEFQSQIGELVGMEFVGLPLYSFGTAGGHAIRMAARINKRGKVLVQSSIDPERLAVFKTYCGYPELDGYLEIVMVDTDSKTGRINLDDLKAKISKDVSSVYFDNPNYLGVIESEAKEIAKIAHDAGAEVIIGIDPISLGVLPSPSEYGADIVVGTNIRVGAPISEFGVVSLKTTCRERWTQDAWTKIYPPRFYYLTTASRDYPDNTMFRESETRKIVTSTPKRRDGRSFKLGFEDLIPELKKFLV